MAVTINAKGTSVQAFTIGKAGTTIYQQSEPVSPKGGDIWFDKDTFSTKVYNEITSAFEFPRMGEIGFNANQIVALDPDGTLDTTFSKTITDIGGDPTAKDIILRAYGTDAGIVIASDSNIATLKVADDDSLHLRGGNSVNDAGDVVLTGGQSFGSGEHGDVIIQGMKFPKTAGTASQFLQTDGAGQLQWATGSGTGSSTLDELDDVNLVSNMSGQALIYDGGTSKWVNTFQTPSKVAYDTDAPPITGVTDFWFDDATGKLYIVYEGRWQEIAEVVQPETITLVNPGFEDDFVGWTEVDPSSISTIAYEGTKSAKLSGTGARVEQDVSVNTNTEMSISCAVLGNATLGVLVDGVSYTQVGTGNDEWEFIEVFFNTASVNTITIFAEYFSEEGRVDQFNLVSNPTTLASMSIQNHNFIVTDTESDVVINSNIVPADGASLVYDELNGYWKPETTQSNDIVFSGLFIDEETWPKHNKAHVTISGNTIITVPTTLKEFTEYEIFIENISPTPPTLTWGGNIVWEGNISHTTASAKVTRFKLFTLDAGVTWYAEKSGEWD